MPSRKSAAASDPIRLTNFRWTKYELLDPATDKDPRWSERIDPEAALISSVAATSSGSSSSPGHWGEPLNDFW